jgi:alkylated DNA repair dioxygenase AlkB
MRVVKLIYKGWLCIDKIMSYYEWVIVDDDACVVVIRQWLPTEVECKRLGVEGKYVTQEQIWKLCESLDFKQYQALVPSSGWINEPRLNYACGDGKVKEHRYSKDRVVIPVESWEGKSEGIGLVKALRDRLLKETDSINNNACLILKYRNERDSIAFHGDKEVTGPHSIVVTISVGATRKCTFKRNSDGQRTHVYLHGGDLCLMWGSKMQTTYSHAIEKQTAPCGIRYSLTFRSLQLRG